MQSEHYILILLCRFLLLQLYPPPQYEVSWIYCSLRVKRTLEIEYVFGSSVSGSNVHNFAAIIPSEDEYTCVDSGI